MEKQREIGSRLSWMGRLVVLCALLPTVAFAQANEEASKHYDQYGKREVNDGKYVGDGNQSVNVLVRDHTLVIVINGERRHEFEIKDGKLTIPIMGGDQVCGYIRSLDGYIGIALTDPTTSNDPSDDSFIYAKLEKKN